jgi:hypothetical protein
MISLTRLRDLDLEDSADARSPRHLSAASGLTCLGSFLYVVADDELHLGVFPLADNAPGSLLRLFPGELPMDKADRKKQKPDLEAIAELPPFGNYPHGALLAFGSGSKKKNRRRGVLLGLDARGAINCPPLIVDFSQLFAELDRRLPALNIEGAFASGDTLCLLQRGNIRHPQNAIVRYPLPAMLDALASGAPVGAIAPAAIDLLALGDIDGVPLTFTDGASLPGDAMVFTAVAENTEDSYNDGACLGAAIGIAESDGTLRFLDRLEGCHKVEGVAARIDGDAIRLLLVTDADDAAVPATLLTGTIPNSCV